MPLALVAGLALIGAGCGSKEPGSDPEKVATMRLTRPEAALATTVNRAVNQYCDQYQEGHRLDRKARYGLQSVLAIGVVGLIALAREKPNAIYNDRLEFGEVRMRQWLHLESQELIRCGRFGHQWGSRLARASNELNEGQ